MFARFRELLRQPSMREQLRGLLDEFDRIRPADAATAEQDRARRFRDANAAYHALLTEDLARNRADEELDRTAAEEIANLLGRIRVLQHATAERATARLQRLIPRAHQQEALATELRRCAPPALHEALANVQALDEKLLRETCALSPASARVYPVREQREACAEALHQLDALSLMGLDEPVIAERAEAIVGELYRRHDEIARRPLPALDEATRRAILA